MCKYPLPRPPPPTCNYRNSRARLCMVRSTLLHCDMMLLSWDRAWDQSNITQRFSLTRAFVWALPGEVSCFACCLKAMSCPWELPILSTRLIEQLLIVIAGRHCYYWRIHLRCTGTRFFQTPRFPVETQKMRNPIWSGVHQISARDNLSWPMSCQKVFCCKPTV